MTRDEWIVKLRRLVVLGIEELERRISSMPDPELMSGVSMWVDGITSREALIPQDDRGTGTDSPKGGARKAPRRRGSQAAGPRRKGKRANANRQAPPSAPGMDPEGQ